MSTEPLWHPYMDLPYGFYATPNPDDPTQLTLWHVRYDLGKSMLPWPYRTRYHRPHATSAEYDAWLLQVVEGIAANLDAARMLFATQEVRCWNCGRRLTSKRSRADGIGPECRSQTAIREE